MYAEFTAKPGAELGLASLVTDLTRQVRAESGNELFNAYTRTGRPREQVLIEVHRDDAAFEEHLRADHTTRFNGALSNFIE